MNKSAITHSWFSILRSSAILGSHIVFPAYCTLCFEPSDAQMSICHRCFTELSFISEPYCNLCGHPFEYAQEQLCDTCLDRPPIYDKARALWEYDDACSKLITRFKYGDATHLASYLGSMMLGLLDNHMLKADMIIPIPLHAKRLRQRKYNQSALLAQWLAHKIQIPYRYNSLIRTLYTPPQVTLNFSQRQQNVDNVFTVREHHIANIKGQHIILVDDVMTTGATICSATKTLKEAGAARVDVILCAKTVI